MREFRIYRVGKGLILTEHTGLTVTLSALAVSLSLLVGCGNDNNPTSPTIENDLFFRSQADVEEFSGRGSKLRIEGGVVVENTVIDLQDLAGIEVIEGSLDIRKTSSLVDLRGLDNLTRVGGTAITGRAEPDGQRNP